MGGGGQNGVLSNHFDWGCTYGGIDNAQGKTKLCNEKYEPLNHIMIFVVFNSLPHLVIVKKMYNTVHGIPFNYSLNCIDAPRSMILFRFYLHSYLKNQCEKLKTW